MRRENQFQAHLIKQIERRLPGVVVLKNDPNYIQGIPDLLILFGQKWAMLECKRGQEEPHQPNQDYYVNLFSNMGFSSFIFPENEKLVLDEMICYFMN